jgi:DNA polymerase-3 subunit epsilon
MVISSSRLAAIQQARKILQEDLVYLDTETTGLATADEIIEVALIDSAELELFNQFVKPTQRIPSSATLINGITDEMVKSALPWPIVWQSLKPLLFNKIIAIYNDDFDIRMMAQSHKRYGLNWNERLKTFDIMKCYAQFYGEWNLVRKSYKYFKLVDACANLQIQLLNSHRAIDDAFLTREVLLAIAHTKI